MKLYQFSKYIQVGLIAAVFASGSQQVFAQDVGTRVGAVNVDKVFSESNMAKQSQARLENEFSKRQNELRLAVEKIKSAAEKLDRDAAVMSEAERSRRQRELAEQDRELQRKQREYNEDLNQRNFEERAKITEKANIALKQVAEQKKLDIIIQDPAFANPKTDVTDDVIKALNSLK
ncbi:OmpH family outer membrane protein [Polynucleobacter sp. AP-Sanab-80-C2]|uniref:OmpH family outer membrane protein n=1 Tax=Polynucleobacter sp. AP-Sanab-80-C2 TaxID=3108274 RepID=UPI002B234635|nr:OmpH family outer membrane protein [Polynucleobacter sp. AP-Sanab-80-C2]MEA9598302.1 OmpH family outer membrane protein [Polynucleobacter sp. AP-Sanab-80-C2]